MIYQSQIGKQNNESSTITIEPNLDDKYVLIDFDFLNKNDGFRIDIYHNSNSFDFDINGTVIGSKKSISKYYNKESVIVHRLYKFINSKVLSFIVILPIGLTFLILSLMLSDELIIKNNIFGDPKEFHIITMFISILYLGMFIIRTYFPNKQYPENLEE